MSTLKLSSTYSIDAAQYASQGNSILGIRDAGKTYTAMKAAEELLDNRIPIICFDPVGIWKNLKIGIGRHKGYPVVVAGGEGSDIILNPNNAKDIVRAAMKENVSLVIDLYSPELINKSTWIRIVQETVDLLMYENKAYGLRHIFLEEAAEFIPQRIMPQQTKVYSSIERLARMGRNARLGYTLINQRAEEVNKAILEISSLMLLHRQVGKNSIASIQKWLELMQVANAKEIIKSLPGLNQGECWAIGNNQVPKLIQIEMRNTFHPDPKKNEKDATVATVTKVDVDAFVEKLNKQLKPIDNKNTSVKTTPKEIISETTKNKLIEEKNQLHKELSNANTENNKLKRKLEKIAIHTRKILEALDENDERGIHVKTPEIITNVSGHQSKNKVVEVIKGDKKLGKCAFTILQFLAQYNEKSFTKPQVGIATGYSPNSGGFNNALSELSSNLLIIKTDGRIKLHDISNLHEWIGDVQHKDYSIHTYKDKLGKCEREIYEVLLRFPGNDFSKEDLAFNTETKYSSTSGGFNNALSTLNTLELIKRESGLVKLNPELRDFI